MNKEPIGLYIFRFILGLGLFAFMGMLYWSETLIEVDVKSLRTDISQLKNELFTLRIEAEKSRADLLQTLLNNYHTPANNENSTGENKPIQRNALQAKTADMYPNLLKAGNFYDEVLPKLLGKGFIPHGIQHEASLGHPENLHPFSSWYQVFQWLNRCTVTLATSEFGKFNTFAPSMATRIEERINPQTGGPEFWVFLRNDVYWHPLKPSFFSTDTHLAPQFLRKNQVTAEDFKLYYDAIMNPYVEARGAIAARTLIDGIEEIRVIDKLTFVVRWKFHENVTADGKSTKEIKYSAKQLTGSLRPLASFIYKYFPNGKKIIEDDSDPETYRTNSVWAQNFSEHWAKNIIPSCGAWIFNGYDERQIKFVRNPDFYEPLDALSDAVEIDLKDSPENIWQEFKNDHLDSYTLQPTQQLELDEFLKSDAYLEQAAKGDAIKQLDYLELSYSYIGWNEAKPFFKSAKVRQALTMAIDRRRIIEQNLNGMGVEITGTFYLYSPSNDKSIEPWPFNPQQAKRLLEQEGWYDSDGDGTIDKEVDGKRIPFSFDLTYYVKNPTTKSICEYISTALKEIGIDCRLHGVDIADLSATIDDKSFDAYMMAWKINPPPENPRQIWSSAGAKEPGSSNTIGFANKEIDEIIEKLEFEYDEQKRIALYHRFDAIIHEEQPYTFLYTPKRRLLYRNYLQNVFLPIDRQDLIPGADVAEPEPSIFWLKK